MSSLPWQHIVLVFASDSSNTSAWHPSESRAFETTRRGVRHSDEISAEHMRALKELFDDDCCANWIPTAHDTVRVVQRAEIDWRGFELGHARVCFHAGAAVVWTTKDGDVEAEVVGSPQAESEPPSEPPHSSTLIRVPVRTHDQVLWANARELLRPV